MSETINSEREPWPLVLKAGLAYFVIVFACGFLLGTFRVLILIPAIGEVRAVMIELPVVLAISWLSSLLLTARFDVSARLIPRLAMGGLAFSLTMVAEVGFSIFAFGRTFFEYLVSFHNTFAILGLLGQLAFASIPAIQLAIRRQ